MKGQASRDPTPTTQKDGSHVALARVLAALLDAHFSFLSNFECRVVDNPCVTMPSRAFPKRSILKLPVELIVLILSQIPDVATLKAAICTSTVWYRAFVNDESRILPRVIATSTQYALLPELYAVIESSAFQGGRLFKGDQTAFETFFETFIRARIRANFSWTLKKAAQAERLMANMDWFAVEFFRYVSNSSSCPSGLLETAPSWSEQQRIRRTLCRFEVYCNLFSRSNAIPEAREFSWKILFFERFPPWENEQLGCLHDFLVRLVSEPFNDLAEHDVAWGVYQIPYDSKADNPYMQHLLSFGLGKIREIASTQTYDERKRLFYTKSPPPRATDFLYEALKTAANEDYATYLGASVDTSVVHRPFSIDEYLTQFNLDFGPAATWKWAHSNEPFDCWVYQSNRAFLRQWGYVLWDASRLRSVVNSSEPWEEDTAALNQVEEEEQRDRAYMENSWEARERVSRMGGSGWWSWGDQSKVEWKKDQHDPSDPWQLKKRRQIYLPSPVIPNSLAEARESLQLLRLPPAAASFGGNQQQ